MGRCCIAMRIRKDLFNISEVSFCSLLPSRSQCELEIRYVKYKLMKSCKKSSKGMCGADKDLKSSTPKKNVKSLIKGKENCAKKIKKAKKKIIVKAKIKKT